MKASQPLSVLFDLFPDVQVHRRWKEALALQNYYLKERGLMPLMSALDPSAELPAPFNNPFQPRPPFTYKWLLSEASNDEIRDVLHGRISLLSEYDRKMSQLAQKLEYTSSRL